MENLSSFEVYSDSSKKEIEYFDKDDIYDVIKFNRITTKDGRDMISITFGNKTCSYLWPYSESNMDVLYRYMQAIESITENSDGKTITIKYKSFTITRDKAYRSYYENLKKEQLKRGNFGCDEIVSAYFEEFGKYGDKNPKTFISRFSDILYLELAIEAGKPIIIVHFSDRLGYAPYSEMVYGVLSSKMKKISGMSSQYIKELCIDYEDGTKYFPVRHSNGLPTSISATPLIMEQHPEYYYYMGLYGNKGTEDSVNGYGPTEYDFDSHILNISLREGLVKWLFSYSPIQKMPVIGQKKGYFYYDIISGERIQRGITASNNRKVLFFGDHPWVRSSEVAEYLREIPREYIDDYKAALRNLKSCSASGIHPIVKIFESLRYVEYQKALKESEEQRKRQAVQAADDKSPTEIRRLLRELNPYGQND